MKKANALILLICLFLLVPGLCKSQSDTISMEEIVVTANRTPLLYNESARVVEIVDIERLRTLPISNINDLLENLSGVDLRSRGFEGMQGDLSIRGGNFDQLLILVDGINITDAQTGHHNLNLPVNMADIKRIEILKGPGARVWGPNAYSGAINIITNEGNENKVSLAFQQGSFNYLNPQVSLSIHGKKISQYSSFSRSSSDGYIENTDFINANLFYKANLRLNSLSCEFLTGHTDKQFGANSFYTPLYSEQFEQVRSSMAAFKANYQKKSFQLSSSIYWRRHQDRFELFRNEAPVWYQSHNFHLTFTKGFKLNASYFTKFGKTSIGYEYREDQIYSNVLGNPMESNMTVPFEQDVFFSKSYNRTNSGVFAEHVMHFGKRLTISAGILANYWNNLTWKQYPGADLSYMILRNRLNFIASYNQSLRMPTFTDLFYKSRTNLGNPDLKPEQTTALESGFKIYNKNYIINATAFVNYGRNIIDWVKLPDTTLWQSMNITELETSGFEISTNYAFPESLGIPFRTLNLGYAYVNVQKSTGNNASLYALDFLRHKLTASVNAKIVSYLFATVTYRWQDRNGYYEQFDKEGKIFIGQQEYNPFSVSDLKLYWQKEKLQIFTECLNCFNEQYSDFGNIPMPKRMYRWGIRADIIYKK